MSDLWFAVDILIGEKGERFRRQSDRTQESESGERGECHGKTELLVICMTGKQIHHNGTW